MCGIVGATVAPLRHDNLEETLCSLHHRGPDARGMQFLEVAGEPVWLGHTRLSILDLSPAGHQPMRSRDGRWWITYNGEIYNHLDIRRRLPGNFRGHSDTETLVEGLAALGIESLLPELNGMFAFAALDTAQGKLHLVRDPFGVKPLYYHAPADGDFAFASEIRALRALLRTSFAIDAGALQTFLTLRYVPSPYTLLAGIRRLPPGHVLTLDLARGQTRLWCYIWPGEERFSGSIDDAVTAYHELLSAAVNRQLLSDVPVGGLLSGGIDSALIAACAKRNGHELPCYTVGFGDGHAECEIDDAANTARVLGLPHRAIAVTPDDLWRVLNDVVRAVEEPLGTTSILPMWYLVRRAREDVTVVLTGQGSDEPWGGYRRYQGEVWRRYLPLPGLLTALRPLAAAWPGLPEFADRALRSLPIADRAQRFEAAYELFTPGERAMLTGHRDSGQALAAIQDWLDWVGAGRFSGAESMMRIDARMNLADDLLLYGDKISMAVSLEARVPMLDRDLVRFVESLPLACRLSLNKTKIVHRLAAQRYLPEAIIQRPKKAFQVPFDGWLKAAWRHRVEQLLLDGGAGHLDVLRREGIARLLREHRAGKRDRSRQLFALLTLAVWWQQTME